MNKPASDALPRTTMAAILTRLDTPLAVAEIGLPPALDVGQVAVRVHVSGICGSQLGEIDGAKGEDKYLPHLLGHEGSGTVLAIGPGVTHVAPGDRVVMHWRKGAGIQSRPPQYSWNGAVVNAGWVTTFNEVAIVSENRLTRVPADTDVEVAALFGCAVTTGVGIVENNARVKMGESVVVFGAGGIGLSVIQAAALVSAHPIIAIDLHDNRLTLAKQLGASHVINARMADAKAALLGILGGPALDVFVDNTGQPSIIELGYAITRPQGRVTLVGVPRKGRDISIYSLPLHFGKELKGSHGGEAIPDVDIPRQLGLYRAGRLHVQELITDRYPLARVNDAIADMRSGKVSGRCVIRMDGSPS